MSDKNIYQTNYENLLFYSLGGAWGYAIMQIRDNNGTVKFRLAKCKKKGSFPGTQKKQWEKVELEQINNLSQVNKINFKSLEELESCYKKLTSEFEKLKENGM